MDKLIGPETVPSNVRCCHSAYKAIASIYSAADNEGSPKRVTVYFPLTLSNIGASWFPLS